MKNRETTMRRGPAQQPRCVGWHSRFESASGKRGCCPPGPLAQEAAQRSSVPISGGALVRPSIPAAEDGRSTTIKCLPLGIPGGGFTLLELLVVMVVLGLILAVALPRYQKPRMRARQVACLGNLKILGLAYRVYAVDHRERYPMQLGTNTGWTAAAAQPGDAVRFYGAMSNELTVAQVLVCPADNRRPATNWAGLSVTNISYFIGLDCRQDTPQAMLGGDRFLKVTGKPVPPGLLVLPTNAAVSWTASGHRGSGNVLFGDGSVQAVPRRRLTSVVQNQGLATNRWLIP